MRALANVEGGMVKAEIELAASPERVFRSLTDSGELAAWWGADDMYRTTDWVIDLRPGGKWSTRAIGVDGSESTVGGEYLEVDPPRRLVFLDGFAHDDGTPNDDFPRSEGRVTIEPIEAGRTRMSIESRFPSTEAMEQMVAMGMEEGLTQAVGQIDAILAEDTVGSGPR